MGELTNQLPKPLLSVGGRPLLLRLLEELAGAGIERIEIVTGYFADRIEEAVLRFTNVTAGPLGTLALRFHRQEELDGTATALELCREACANEPFLASWGDVLASSSDYRSMIETVRAETCDQVLGINRVDDPSAGAAIYLDERGCVERIVEKPPAGTSKTFWNNAGIFLFQPTIFEYLEAVQPSPGGERELPTAVEAMIADGLRIRAHEIRGWRHIGTPEELEEADRLSDKNQERRSQ